MSAFELRELASAGVSVLDCEHRTPKAQVTGYPYIAIPDVVAGRVHLSTSRRISDADLRDWNRRTVPHGGDVLVTRRGRVGDSAAIPDGIECAIGQNLVLLRSTGSEVRQDFLRWAARSPQWWSEVERLRNVGAVFSSLNVRDISRINIPVPCLPEQHAITAVLDALDNKIAVNGQLADQLSKLATATFEQAVYASPTERSILEITKLVSRGITPAYYDSCDSVTVLNQRCIRDQVILLGPARKTRPERVRAQKILLPNDVLINSTGQGTLGRVARWTYDHEATVDSHISIVRFDESVVDPICAGYGVLRLQPLIEQMGEGTTGQTELSRVELAKVRVRLPHRDSQLPLGCRLEMLSKLQESQRAQSEVLAAMRDALLPQLMSGKIRVKDAEKTVEEVL